MPLATSQSYRSSNRRHDRQFFYKYVTAKIAKIVLTTRTLRWSSPVLFNDPFDVTQELRLNFTEEEINAALNNELATLIQTGIIPDAAPPAIKSLLIVSSQGTPDQRRLVADDLRESDSS